MDLDSDRTYWTLELFVLILPSIFFCYVCQTKETTQLAVWPMLTLWRPPLPYGYSYKASCCNFWHRYTLTLSPERQNARMSKITNDGLTRSGTWCFVAVPIWQRHSSRKRTKHGKRRKKSRLFGFWKKRRKRKKRSSNNIYAYGPEDHGDHPQSVLLSFAQ